MSKYAGVEGTFIGWGRDRGLGGQSEEGIKDPSRSRMSDYHVQQPEDWGHTDPFNPQAHKRVRGMQRAATEESTCIMSRG